jgi:hypothetical protein
LAPAFAKIGSGALQSADRHRFQLRSKQTCLLAKALVLADAPADSRKRAALMNDSQSPVPIGFDEAIDKGSNIDVHRAGLYALWVSAMKASKSFLLYLAAHQTEVDFAAA